MQVPLLDLKAQFSSIRDEVQAAINGVLESQIFILGPEVERFEKEIAQYTGTKHAIGMSSGSDALLAALMAMGIGPRDEVITTTYSFFATAGAIHRLGAKPVFVDIQPDSFNIDPEQVARKVSPRTKAIIPVHLFGRCADLSSLLQLGIPIIEDAAQAIGATTDSGQQAGSIGKCGCFSFFPSKNLGCFGDGGMVVTNDDDLANHLRILRSHGSKPKYYHKVVGGNFRLDALQAAVLRVKLKHLGAWTEGRRSNADRYRQLIAARNLGQKIRMPLHGKGDIYNQFVVRVANRDGLRKRLESAGIGTEVYYPVPLHLQECFSALGHKVGDLPHAELAANNSLALPIYPELTSAQQTHVVEELSGLLE